MNTNAFARIATVLALSLAACGMAQAKGGSLGVGLTIVSSCTASSANVYGAVSSVAAASTGVAMKAGCSSDAAYMVSTSADTKASGSTSSTEAGDVVVTLTY